MTRTCTAVWCSSGLTWLVDSPVSAEELAGADVEYCHDGQCHGGVLPAPSEADGTGVTLLTDENEPFAKVTVMKRADGLPWLELTPVLRADELTNGDVYRVTVTDAAGNVLLQAEEKVDRYEDVYANGPDCGKTCTRAIVDRRGAPES